MPLQTIIWTALPNGIANNGKLRLSVHIAPRLVPDGAQGQLQDFPDWEVWPNTSINGWQVHFPAPTGVQIFSAQEVTSPSASAARWSDLFASTTPVRGRVIQDFTRRRIRSYPVGHVVGHLRDHYVATALVSGDQFPDRNQLSPFLGPLLPDALEVQIALVEQQLTQNFALAPASPDPKFDFAQLLHYHTPGATRDPGLADAPQVPQFDFHDMCSLAQDHPFLLRLLRLVVDLEVDGIPELPGSPLTTVRVVPDVAWQMPAAQTTSVLPLTWCIVDPGARKFVAAPGPVGEVVDGYLPLDDPNRYGVAIVDQDGGGLKAINLAANLHQSDSKRSVDTPDRFALSALRSQAIAVYRTGRAAALRSNRFLRGMSLDADLTTGNTPGDNVQLFADDLLQGARFDVLDGGAGQWRSLSARSGSHRFTTSNAVETVNEDEGITNAAATTPHKGPSDDLYLGETVLAWNGWSIGAPRPTKVLDNSDQLIDQQSQAHQNGLPLEIAYLVKPGSLPRLRYGSTYRLRGRAVDVAGNSLPLTDPSAQHATPDMLFGRLEPVESPTVLLRKPIMAGDAVDRVVLRSNYNTPPSPATAERHVVAPKVSQRTCELHGMFDTPAPNSLVDGSQATYALIAGREAKAFRSPDHADAQADPSGDDVFYFDVDTITVPYLPDPVAIGAFLRGIGDPTDELAVDYDGPWPDLMGVRLVVREQGAGDPPFLYSPAEHRLDVFLEKAERRIVRVSSLPIPARILEFGLWQWIVEAGVIPPQLQSDIEHGRHWMFTPFRTLTLVHAVKQPLVEPQLDIALSRNPGETFALLTGGVSLSRKSSGRIDLEASWNEFLDAGPGGVPAPTRPDPNNPGSFLDSPERHAIALSVPVGEAGPDGSLNLTQETPAPGPRHNFGDTKHRTVSYLPRAYSRFDDFFRVGAAVDFGVANPAQVDANGVVPGSVRLTATVNTSEGPRTIAWTEGVDFSVDPATGTVTKLNSALPDQAQASWVPRPNDRQGQPVTLEVPSSTRPDPPKVLYIIPTFSWEDTSDGGSRGRRRQGGGLRVYLERPWWTSGGGELLGVLLAEQGSGQAPLGEPAARVATQWGIDPVHAGAQTPDLPALNHFPLRTASGGSLEVPEAPGVPLAVAGHAVGFDSDRDLWFCDLQVDTGPTWMPFMRLALTRYQPNALAGLNLSQVVLADFVQLAAERTATVTAQPFATRRSRTFAVQLTGPTYQTSAKDAAGPRTVVTVQQRLAGVSDPLLGWESLSQTELTRQVFAGPTVVYAGNVSVPTSALAAGARLLIEEFEQVRVDGGAGGHPRYGNRPVYVDAIELPAP